MGLFSPTFDTLEELYINELRDLYSAETQLVEALPTMVEAASCPKLKKAFASHLQETKGQVVRLEKIFHQLDEKPSGETCAAMKGLIKEAGEYANAGGNKDVRDAGIIGAAQRIEHYEMAGYGVTRSLAEQLGETAAVDLLQMTLDEEGGANKKLTEIATSEVNARASRS